MSEYGEWEKRQMEKIHLAKTHIIAVLHKARRCLDAYTLWQRVKKYDEEYNNSIIRNAFFGLLSAGEIVWHTNGDVGLPPKRGKQNER